MNSLKARATVYKHTPADPTAWGSVETWARGKTFRCAFFAQSPERNVRAGRDSAEKTLELHYNAAIVHIDQADRVEVDGRTYAIMVLHSDSSGEDTSYMELKAL